MSETLIPPSGGVSSGEAAGATFVDHGATGAAENIDVTAGEWHRATQDQACTYTFTAPPDDGQVYVIKLLLTTITGVPTWPASVNWPDAAVPSLAGRSWLTFVTLNGGTDWDGFVSGKALA